MTFGEKLYQLRKAHGFSQESLAEKLNTSRQAVSKWENNNGYPETEKIILMSKIFGVDLNHLLMEDQNIFPTKEGEPPEINHGIYVNRETATGFLLYYKKKFLLLAVACGVILGCNSASYMSTEHTFFSFAIAPLLTNLSVMVTLAIVVYIFLKQNPYRMLRKKKLDFSSDVRREIEEEFHKMKKMLIVGAIFGLTIFGGANSSFSLELIKDAAYSDIMLHMAISMILSGISSFITFFCIGVYWSYSVLLRNSEHNINYR